MRLFRFRRAAKRQVAAAITRGTFAYFVSFVASRKAEQLRKLSAREVRECRRPSPDTPEACATQTMAMPPTNRSRGSHPLATSSQRCRERWFILRGR